MFEMFVWEIRLHFMRLCTTPTLLVVLQRVTRSSTASPTSPTRMSGSGSRNGSWWTCRLSTTEWGWLAPCGSCALSTSTTRSACRRLYVEVVPFILPVWSRYHFVLLSFFFLPFFKGERHVPCRSVCTWVGHAPSHRGQLQVQEPRQISYPVLLLQGNSCTSIPFSLFCLVLVKRLVVADEIHSFIQLLHFLLLQLFHFLWAVNSWNFTKTRKQKFKILCVRYQQILMHSC